MRHRIRTALAITTLALAALGTAANAEPAQAGSSWSSIDAPTVLALGFSL